MFDRYTQRARRVIFFAHRAATEHASPWIETEHLLLGLLQESSGLVSRFLRSSEEIEAMRARIAERWPRRNETAESGDLPLSAQCQRVLAYAAEESMRLQDRYIASVHLLLGLVREQQGFAGELLHDCGLRLSKLRKEIASNPPDPEQPGPQLRGGTLHARAR
jgi:ATP-dependent Clp protease ATP-binding subunit ClpC